MAEPNGNNKTNGKNPPLEERIERVFDIYMKECGTVSLDDKFISELERRMNSKVESKYVAKAKPDKRKIFYEMEDSGEIIIDEDIIKIVDGENITEKIDRDITVSSYKKDLHDELCLYIIHFNAPKRGRAIFYENSDINMDPPKQLIVPMSNYAKEVHEKYSFRPSFFDNLGQVEFRLREEKNKV
jgi:hypothetical protein